MSHDDRMELLKAQPGETISPAILARILGGNPYAYDLAAKEGQLPLPHVWRGRNLRIIKAPLLRLLEQGKEITI